ncbi:LOW QUALITY PROTEIN: hypothetical protein Fmac_032811 [Flemingia macrophylla]|uniref:Uncharacterized protein n=1 Tax=Flemingia macrophylla TaxID=520843 RepID=A0ABD1L7E2_9FABA
MAPNSYQFSARNDVIDIRGVQDVATDTSVETKKLEGKLDALVNLVTQEADVATETSVETRKLEGKLDVLVNMVTHLAMNQKPASVARVCGIHSCIDHHTSVVILCNNLEWMSILRLMLRTPITDHHSSREKALDREDGSQLQFTARNDASVIRRVHDVATDTSAEARKLKGKPDALVNLQFSTRNDAIVIRRVHDVATDTSAETRKLEGKLDALVNLVTPLAANQKPSTVARQFSARTDAIVIRRVHDVARDTSAETRKLEGKLDAIVNLVTQLAANQKPASIARVSGIRSSDDHHTSQFSARNDANFIRGVHYVTTDTSVETRKLDDKLDALVNLVTQLAANQKPALLQVFAASQSRVDEHPEAYAGNTYSRPPQ